MDVINMTWCVCCGGVVCRWFHEVLHGAALFSAVCWCSGDLVYVYCAWYMRREVEGWVSGVRVDRIARC